MARCSLLVALAFWGATPAGAQLLRGYPSYMTSSSWSSTFSNGRVVEHKESSRSATSSDGRVMELKESNIHCKDGRCSQSVSFSGPNSAALVTREGPFVGMPRVGLIQSRLVEMLGRFRPWRTVQPIPDMPRSYPIEPRRPTAILFLAPRSAQPQTNATAPTKPMSTDLQILVASLVGASVALTTLIASAFLRCRLAQSHELPLRSLGEPLAPTNQEALASLACTRVACPVIEKESEDKESMASAVDGYLEQMYMRAIQRVDKVATQRYLGRVYEKACA